MDIAERLARTRPGQLSTVRPDLGNYCTQCRHLGPIREKKNAGNVARCSLVKAHTKKDGVEFLVDSAIACIKFER